MLRINVINVEQLVTSAVETYLEERKLHNQGLANQNHALSQDPHNQDALPHQDGEEADDMEAEQMNSGKTTPLQSSFIVPEVGGALVVGGASEGGGDEAKRGEEEQSSNVKLSAVGALGEKAYTALRCGIVVEDHLIIDILMEELRSVS